MVGLLDLIAGSNDPSTADPNTGLVEAQRRQLGYSILGQTGAALLAAGAPHMPGQEAPYLAQLGQIPGNVAQQQAQMVSQNAVAQRAQLLKEKVAQEKAAATYIQTPEYQQMLDQMPAVLKAQALVNIKAGDYGAATKIVSDYTALQIQAAREKAQLENAPPTVTHDANGQPIAYDRKTRTWQPITTQFDPSAAYGLGPAATPAGAATGGAPKTLPDGTPITDTASTSAPNPYPNASINPNLPYHQAFGVGGATTYGLGRLGGTLGTQLGPETSLQNAAVAQYDKARTELLNEARAESPGSARIKAAYNAINETLPVAGSAFHDSPYALKQLVAARDSLSKELDNTTRMFQAPATKPAERQKLAADIMSLRKNLDNVNIVVDKLSQTQGGTKEAKPTTGRLRFNLATGQIE